METGLQAMKIGSIIYFVPFFFVMNPSLVLQGEPDATSRCTSSPR